MTMMTTMAEMRMRDGINKQTRYYDLYDEECEDANDDAGKDN